ncbi:MAG TPA: hypothetical protein V6D17_10790, partial [Candidatus Obscuribacterales bacterium]
MDDSVLEIDALLSAPRSQAVAEQLVEWADKTRCHILRGDMMIGILSMDEVAKIPAAYEAAALSGLTDAWVKLAWWYATPEFGDADVEMAEASLNKAIAAGVPEAQMELVKIVWFFKRETATDSQKRKIVE